MTRNGKIARLPQPIREQINRRLENGEEGKQIVEWLNTLPEVTALLAAGFDGQPINEPNLSRWKLGGYRDWEDQQAALETILQFQSEAVQLSQAGGPQVTGQLALCLTARLAAALRPSFAGCDDPAQRMEQLRRLRRDIVALRKGDHDEQWVKIQRDKLELELKKFEYQAALQKRKMEPHVRLPRPECGITDETIAQFEKDLKLI
jgi:hypothetical protein